MKFCKAIPMLPTIHINIHPRAHAARLLLFATLLTLLSAFSARAQSGNWNVNANGNWSAAGNWSPAAVPGNAAGDVVGLTYDITTNRTVTLDTTSRTVGTLNIGDPTGDFAYTLSASGGANLVFDQVGVSNAYLNFPVTTSAVANVINAPITLNDNLVVSVDSAWSGTHQINGVITDGANIYSITFNGTGPTPGTVFMSAANTYDGGTFIVRARVRANTSPYGFGTGRVTVSDGGQAFLSNGGNMTNAFTIAGLGYSESAGAIGAMRLQNATEVSGPITLSANARIAAHGNTGTVGGPMAGNYELELANTSSSASTITCSSPSNTTAATRLNALSTGILNALVTTGGALSKGPLYLDGPSTLQLNGYNLGFARVTNGISAATIGNYSTSAGATVTLGSDNSSFSYSGTLINGGSQALGLTKVGSGTMTLSGNNSFSGSTTISNGTLALVGTGSIASSSPITVVPGALFEISAGSFTLGSSKVLNAGRTNSFATDINGSLTSTGILEPVGNGTAGTMTINGALNLNGGGVNFDLSTTNGLNDRIAATGALNLSGTTTLSATWSGGLPSPGAYTLISAANLVSGGTNNFSLGTGLNVGGFDFSLNVAATPGTVVLTVVTNGQPVVTNPPPRPNVVVVITDDQVFDSIRCLGNSVISTPNIDRICTNGMIFNKGYIMGGWGAAVCQPSRTMFLTGRSLWRLPGYSGNTNYPPNLELKSMPAVFNNGGYDTIRSGKAGNVYAAANAQFTVSLFHDLDHNSYDPADKTASSLFVDDALNWISNRQATVKTNPMLIYLGFSHPHDPRRAPQTFLNHFNASEPNPNPSTPLNLLPPLPPNYLPLHPFDNGHLGVRDEVEVEGVTTNRDERTIRNELGKVYATIEYLDSQVGRLLAKLDAMNQFTNTYFVFTADNGIANGRHGLMGKQNLYDHSLRVPLAISGPGISPGTNNSLVYLLDVFPTLCDLTGMPIPDTVEGVSLAPILRGQTNSLRSSILGCYRALQRAVRVGDWKIIHYPLIHRTQLFNLAADPHETNDLSGAAVQADRILQLETQLIALQTEYGDYQRLGALGYVGANAAWRRPAWQSSTLSGSVTFAATNATDGAGSTLTGYAQTADADANAWWMVDLGQVTDIEEILLHNRADASQGRLRDITIQILDDQTNVVATSALLNPDNTLGGGLNDFATGPDVLFGGFTNTVPVGRFVRVSRAPSSVGSGADKNALALSEVQVFAAPYDSDADAISDRWEREWFGDLTTASATTDWDHDGALDAHEAIAGTNPKDPLSLLKVDRITTQPTVTLEFLAISNRTYTVQYRDGLLTTNVWTGLTNLNAQPTNRVQSVTDPGSPATPRYYRLVTPGL